MIFNVIILCLYLPVIKLSDVWKSYKIGETKIDVLKGVNLRVVPGEMVGIFGPSGSGKTTLLNIISTLDFADKGFVEIMENEISPEKFTYDKLAEFRRKHIAIIFQSHNLMPEMNAFENVYFPLLLKGYSPKRAKKRAEDVLEAVEIGKDRMFKNIQLLSGGERQRVAVARALAMDVDIFVCDEPTSELDRKNAMNLMHIMNNLRVIGKTFVIATHDERLLEFFTSVYRLEDGVLIKMEKKEV
jgi:putative ABC transport system ATP-binding protein